MKALVYYLPIAILLLLWELCSRTGILSPDIVPSFSATMLTLWQLLASGELPHHIGISMFRTVSGLGAAIVLGICLGIGMAYSDVIRAMFEPTVQATYPLPKSALIPVLLLWFGLGDMSKIAAIFLGCLLPVVVSSFNGARGVASQVVWSARSFGTGRLRILWKIVLMAAMPDILSGIRIALAMSFVLLISAELLASSAGLGYLIGFFGSVGNYPAMFAVIVAVTIIGFAADRLYRALMRYLLRWQGQDQ